jgi:hypothetical protein
LEKITPETLKQLSAEPLQRFIRDHEKTDERTFVLHQKEVSGIPAALIADQIGGRKKCKDKLPGFYQTSGIIYPPSINLEQASSEQTALFKTGILAQLFPSGAHTGVDLTGGFGVDAFYMSKMVRDLHFVERNSYILEIAKHNHAVLGVDNIHYHVLPAEKFMEINTEGCDFVYADPSRRTTTGKKIQALQDSEPDIVKLSLQIMTRASFLLVKTSPLLDIQAGIMKLPSVKKVFVLSVDNECKEVLFLCQQNFSGIPGIETVNLPNRKNPEVFQFTFSTEREAQVDFSDPLKYLYEPNASILKAGAFRSIASHFGVKKIEKNTHLYTADHLIAGFPGRVFLIAGFMRPDPAEAKKYFPDGKANVTTRNYPLSVQELKKKTGLKDGGDLFAIGFSGQQKKFLVVAKRQ